MAESALAPRQKHMADAQNSLSAMVFTDQLDGARLITQN
jgi:hypothetical protein